jgi:hypothetical protein
VLKKHLPFGELLSLEKNKELTIHNSFHVFEELCWDFDGD